MNCSKVYIVVTTQIDTYEAKPAILPIELPPPTIINKIIRLIIKNVRTAGNALYSLIPNTANATKNAINEKNRIKKSVKIFAKDFFLSFTRYPPSFHSSYRTYHQFLT